MSAPPPVVHAHGFPLFGPPTLCGDGVPSSQSVIEVTCPACHAILCETDGLAKRIRVLEEAGVKVRTSSVLELHEYDKPVLAGRHALDCAQRLVDSSSTPQEARTLAVMVLQMGELGLYVGQRVNAHHGGCPDGSYLDGRFYCDSHQRDVAVWHLETDGPRKGR